MLLQIHRCVERGVGADSEYAREHASQNSTIVYGSRWTFYGAVGRQLRKGYFYIAGYIGPLLLLALMLAVFAVLFGPRVISPSANTFKAEGYERPNERGNQVA